MDVVLFFVRDRCITLRSQRMAPHTWGVRAGLSLLLFSFQGSLSDFKKVNKIWLVHLCLTSRRLVQVSIDKINSTTDWVLSLAIDISTPTIEDDKHFIFFTITIYMYVIQNSMSIYFCPINYDQKRLIELNSFKMEIFTILKRIKFN